MRQDREYTLISDAGNSVAVSTLHRLARESRAVRSALQSLAEVEQRLGTPHEREGDFGRAQAIAHELRNRISQAMMADFLATKERVDPNAPAW